LESFGQYDPDCIINIIRSDYGKFSDASPEKLATQCKRLPTPSSGLFVELIEKSDGKLVVRVNYNGEYLNVCGLRGKKDAGGKWDCSFAEFQMILNKKMTLLKNFD
jgi:hypothetical protein